MTTDSIILVDPRKNRREAVQSTLRRFGLHVQQRSSVDELPVFAQSNGIFLVADEGNTIEVLMDYLGASHLPNSVVAFGEAPQIPSVVKAIKAGVTDYLSWPMSEDAILPAIIAASRQVASRDDEDSAEANAFKLIRKLTKREMEVIRAVSMGKTSREIGLSIGISCRTVEIHRGNALKKLGARNSSEAVRVLRDALVAMESMGH
ncbi:LuxR C-terminal-related transcriptional regulator [Novosphingobium sp. MW5]|nr:LuxR C-terminal-related transcriptional regulator [Novosphingobium sp. MW5]